MSTLVSVPQWDPIAIFSINQKPDGNFTCVGVKNNTTDSCGYHIKGGGAAKINQLIDDISSSPPQTAAQSLRVLADLSLCHNHGSQAGRMVKEWNAAIRSLSFLNRPVSDGSNAYTPSSSPSPQPNTTPQSTPGNNLSAWASATLIRPQENEMRKPAPFTSNGTVGDEIVSLKKEIENLAARIAFLEAGSDGSGQHASRRKASNRSPVRSGLRSALLGRGSN